MSTEDSADWIPNNPLNKERVALWEQALRDPALRQGHGCLARRLTSDENEPWQQCCLDVACRVAMANGVVLQEIVKVTDDPEVVKRGYSDGSPGTEFSVLPPVVRDWYGLPGSWVPLVVPVFGEMNATNVNDELKLPFAQIADLIKATYLEGEDSGE